MTLMKKDLQRIAIAESMGWVRISHDQDGWKLPHHRLPRMVHHLPDYLNDLNAMHEAEKVFDESKISSFCMILSNMLPLHTPEKIGTWVFHATASQRAEAFLKTLDLWEE